MQIMLNEIGKTGKISRTTHSAMNQIIFNMIEININMFVLETHLCSQTRTLSVAVMYSFYSVSQRRMRKCTVIQ